MDFTREIYIQSYHEPLGLQVILHLGAAKKLGGEAKVRVIDYEPNVLHGVATLLHHSPDK